MTSPARGRGGPTWAGGREVGSGVEGPGQGAAGGAIQSLGAEPGGGSRVGGLGNLPITWVSRVGGWSPGLGELRGARVRGAKASPVGGGSPRQGFPAWRPVGPAPSGTSRSQQGCGRRRAPSRAWGPALSRVGRTHQRRVLSSASSWNPAAKWNLAARLPTRCSRFHTDVMATPADPRPPGRPACPAPGPPAAAARPAPPRVGPLPGRKRKQKRGEEEGAGAGAPLGALQHGGGAGLVVRAGQPGPGGRGGSNA